jgi:DnaJ like chaperone protein
MSLWSRLSQLARRAFDDGPDPSGDTDCFVCGPDPNDVDFTAAVVGLGAKLAKADGLVTTQEMQAFTRIFRVRPGEEAAMLRVFDIARQSVTGYQSYARRIARRYAGRPCLLEGVLDGLFQIAGSDGAITADEIDYLRSVSEAFGFSEADFRRIRASHLGPEADDPYLVLGVEPDADFDTIRAAYRKLMRENHPDVIQAVRQAPLEFEPVAHEKAAAITSAYARIRVERGFMARPD